MEYPTTTTVEDITIMYTKYALLNIYKIYYKTPIKIEKEKYFN